MDSPSNIRSQLEVRAHPTVVRLDDLGRDGTDWIAASFVRTPEIRRHLEVVERLLERDRGSGVFLIGHYGSGKSHLLAHIVQRERCASGRTPLTVAALSLVNYSAANRLEDIVAAGLGLESAAGDRRPAHDAWLEGCSGGAMLVLDELSEFLRSKPNAQAFNEDVRYLQFLGEWAQDRRFWILAAMQESIEHTGELEYHLYRKIKDRYPIRLMLTPAHVETLIADGILIKGEGYAGAVAALVEQFHEALPGASAELAALGRIYPLHPVTLHLLEEVRDRFSQSRGVVDFVVTRLAGDPARGVAPFLDREWGALLTPDAIVDHFRDVLELQPEFLPLAQQLFPWYERHLDELFERDAERVLAMRLLKLLVLVHLSPSRERLTAEEAARWLLFRATRLDPARNTRIVARILDGLGERGRHVERVTEGYRLSLGEGPGAVLDERLRHEVAELRGRDELILETLVALLPASSFNPFTLARETWQHREVSWCFHRRRYAVWLGDRSPPRPADELGLCLRLPWGEHALAIGAFTVLPGRMQVGDELAELAAMARLAARPLGAEESRRLDKRIAGRLPIVEQAVRNAWLEADMVAPDGRREPIPRLAERMTLDSWLDACALWMLRRTYPAFERLAPAAGPLPKEAWRRYVAHAVEGDPGDYDAGDHVKVIREGYLVPMGLLRRAGRDYTLPAAFDKHELVELLAPMLEHDVAPARIYDHLAEPIYGLVPDQVTSLLVTLVLHGTIDLLKDGRAYRECYETLPDPRNYDRIVPAHALAPEQINALERLCEAFRVRVPKQWTVLAQRRAARALAGLAERRGRALGELARRLVRARDVDPVLARIEAHRRVWNTLEAGADPMACLELFLAEAGATAGFVDEAQALEGLGERLPRLLAELERLRHLARHPMREGRDVSAVDRIFERVGEPPPLHEADALEQWLAAVNEGYAEHKASYAERHQRWWAELLRHPVWAWRPPGVARSRHLALDDALARYETAHTQADRARCPGLVNLDFQPLCACGFDGESAPAAAAVEQLEALRGELESELERFFAQASVRRRMGEWAASGLEDAGDASAYLDGAAACPVIGDVALLDRHLAGLDIVKEVDATPLVELLASRVWTQGALGEALERFVAGVSAERVRLRLPSPSPAPGIAPELARWCAQTSMEHVSALPRGLARESAAAIAAALRPEWVTGRALEQLEALRLPEAAVDRVLGWLLDGTVAIPAAPPRDGALLDAIALLARQPAFEGGADLAAASATLYRHHHRLERLAGQAWLDRLARVAEAEMDATPSLVEVLAELDDHQWLLVDCLGLALLGAAEDVLSASLADWGAAERRFARVSADSSTDGCYRELVAAGINHPFAKIDAVDELIHRDFRPFTELTQVAVTELELGLVKLRRTLDPGRPLAVFADHGFRISADGRRYEHGGPSTLERTVPVWTFAALGSS